MECQEIPEEIINDSNRCITGRFIWFEGMLFFRPEKEGTSLNDYPLRLPNETHAGLNVHLADMTCWPAEKVVSFLPDWLEGYEALQAIHPEAVSMRLRENPIEVVIEKTAERLAVFLAQRLANHLQQKGDSDAESSSENSSGN